jgi:hypothetical protein
VLITVHPSASVGGVSPVRCIHRVGIVGRISGVGVVVWVEVSVVVPVVMPVVMPVVVAVHVGVVFDWLTNVAHEL